MAGKLWHIYSCSNAENDSNGSQSLWTALGPWRIGVIWMVRERRLVPGNSLIAEYRSLSRLPKEDTPSPRQTLIGQSAPSAQIHSRTIH